MHGRLKVKTTAEQQEEKRIEREKKSKLFLLGMKIVFENRYKKEERGVVLSTSEKLLSGNSDVTTLWNIRKEIFLDMKNENENIEEKLHRELKLIQNCLHGNPKSYGSWNQRRFVMLTLRQPDWHEEMRLCNLLLKSDERNFHCWDYRRFVVKQANISAQDEFDFTTQKIIDNFSNYSAWHNRSKLLPILKPDISQSGKVEEASLLKEFELVQNAFFTDPNDQSAWFYQRWLLGRREQQSQLLSVSLKRNPLRMITSFSSQVQAPGENDILVNGATKKLIWKSIDAEHGIKHAFVWHCELDDDISKSNEIGVEIHFTNISNCPEKLTLVLSSEVDSNDLCWTKDMLSSSEDSQLLFSDTHTEAKTSVLQNELEACKMLLDEEPNNKWTMLTVIYLMRALNGLKYEKDTEELLTKLLNADPMRKGYYEELRSKYRLENLLQKKRLEKKPLTELDLSGMDLTCLPYSQYFNTCKVLNLSNNKLSNLSFISQLVGVEKLDLSNNNLEEVLTENIQMKLPWKIDISL